MKTLALLALLLAAPAAALEPDPLSVVTEFFVADPSFTGGVTVATCGHDADGRLWLVSGLGAGDGGSRFVIHRVLPEGDLQIIAVAPHPYAVVPYAQFTGGITVGCTLGPDGHLYVMTGAGPGGGPHVRVIRVRLDLFRQPEPEPHH